MPEVRRHRLELACGKVADAEPDLAAAISEPIGHDGHPGLWCLAPWQHDGHPDHDAVGRVAETICDAYQVRLVRYLVAAWTWLQPDDLPWPLVRHFDLSGAQRARKTDAITPRAQVRDDAHVAGRELFLI